MWYWTILNSRMSSSFVDRTNLGIIWEKRIIKLMDVDNSSIGHNQPSFSNQKEHSPHTYCFEESYRIANEMVQRVSKLLDGTWYPEYRFYIFCSTSLPRHTLSLVYYNCMSFFTWSFKASKHTHMSLESRCVCSHKHHRTLLFSPVKS